jgi:short-subunit dehydrogenase
MERGSSGRTAVVTGAARGIGHAIAARLAAGRRNLQIILRTRATIAGAAKAIGAKHGVSVRAHALDLS